MRQGFVLLLVTTIALLSGASVFAAEGRTPGQFAVGPSGSAQYSIPIWTPPGPRGIQPNLALVYNSQSGIGSLGIGWHIAGLGAITRCNKTYAQDTTPAPVALVTTDGYCINGSRLRLTSGTYGTAGSVYQTEIADFSQITANGAAGNGPASFTVQGRNGLTYEYGVTDNNGNGANSQVLASGTSTADAWLLSKVIDRVGNNYVINYTALTGTAVPNTILWTPTSAGASTYAYTMQFNYGANVPQSSLTKYVGGTAVTNTKLLSSIAISYSGTVVKDYFLGYQASPTTGRDELISVKECADSGQSNCLLPTSITYQNGAAGVSTTATTALSSTTGGVTARYDLNGDGIPDLVYAVGSTSYVAFGSASGTYGTPISIPAPYLIGNLTGGSEDGILTQVSGTWWYYVWNGSSFVGTSTGLAVDSAAVQWQLADVNGDGLPDLVGLYVVTVVHNGIQHTTTSVQFRLNTSTGSTVSFSPTLTSALIVQNGAQLWTPDAQNGMLRRYDFDGDGRDDLVLVEASGNPASVYTYELISTGTGFNQVLVSTIPGSTYVPVFFANWNDDACTDFVSSGTLYLSGCNGTVPTTFSVGNVVAAMDWDGDGRTDLVVVNGSTLGVYLSTGAGVSSLVSTSIPYTSTCQYVTMGVNGDGLDALGCVSQTSPYPFTYRLHNGAGQPPDLVSSIMDGYGNSASPTYVSIAESNYSEHGYGEASSPDADYIGPLYVVSKAVFSDPSSAPGVTYYQTFWYYGGWMNLQGRGFDGFGIFGMFDSRNGLEDFKYYERAFPYTGMQYQESVVWNGFNPTASVGTTALTTLSTTTNQQRYFPYYSNWTRYQSEVGGTENSDPITTSSTNYTYDNYGNALTVDTTVTDTDPGSPYLNYSWTTNTTNTTDISVNQTADLAAWCLNMLDETQVVYSSTLPGSTSVTRTKIFTPDTPTACRIQTAVTEPTANSGLYKVTEALTFDSFGNVQTDTVTGNNMPSSPANRVTTLNWGTTGQFLNTSTDPSNATTTWTYTSPQALAFGIPDTVKNANNLTTSWVYDAFGRKIKETRPDGTSTTWTWTACTSNCGWSNSVYQIAQTAYQTNGTTAIRTDTTSYDPIDRVSQTAGPNVTGATATVQTLYNSLGLLAQRSMPFLSGTPYQQSYSYDVLNRVTSVTRPISSTNSNPQSTTYAYAGRKLTVSDPYGHTKTTVTDVNGWLRQTKDAVGYNVTRAYDSAGSVIGITDSVGNSLLKNVTYNYGIKPFLIAATDADRGAWVYTVDSLGERIGWTDAKGQSFSKTYDSLSRSLTRTEPDLFTQWTWGSTAASFNVGQLIAECTGTAGACSSAGYSESRTFDSYGRLSTRAITQGGNPGNDPGGVFLFTSSYSATTGLPNTLTYPISTSGFALTLQYGYGYGLLSSVTDTSDTTGTCGTTCTLWAANSMNAFGQVTQETLGNGVVTNRTYDAVTSWLSAATAGVGGGATLLNQSYLEDEDGNIIQRQNNNLGLTESFAYDADNRLTCTALSSTCTTPTLAYDGGAAGPGNITSLTGLGTYAYPAAGQPQPHAVSSLTGTFNGIVNPSFSYDANGNMTNRASSTQNVYWFSYNYPSSISGTDTTGSEEVQFTYGPDRQRWKQIYTGPSGTETTYYIGGLIDLVFNAGATDYRHYIYAGSEPVAVYSRTAASVNTMRYMFEDHQGGVSTIASNSGAPATATNESFTALGQRRSPATWSGAPTTQDLNTIAGISRQGYTFQTWLGQSMGLNHMNGRVEDAILGRFLSPDPHIPDPSNAQSYNRYSYVNNNPLTLTDPTGFTSSNMKPGMPCVDYCSIPAGVGHWKPSLLQSVFGGQSVSGSSTGVTGNTGDGVWNNFSFNNPDQVTGTATVGQPMDPQEVENQSLANAYLASHPAAGVNLGTASPELGIDTEDTLTATNYALAAAGMAADSVVESAGAQLAADSAWSMRTGLTVDIATHYEAAALSFLGSGIIKATGFGAVGIDAIQTFTSANPYSRVGHGISTGLDLVTAFAPWTAPVTFPAIIFIDTLPAQFRAQQQINEGTYQLYQQTGLVPTMP